MSEALTAPDFSTIPVGPLALIALPGCEELAAKIDAYLKTWREIRESEHKTTIAFSGYQRDSYLIKAAFPRFGRIEVPHPAVRSRLRYLHRLRYVQLRSDL